MRLIRQRPIALLACLVGVIGAIWASNTNTKHTASTLRNYQLRACEKVGNPSRQQTNRNGKVILALLQTARKARLETARLESSAKAKADRHAARVYRSLTHQIAPAPVVDCQKLYPKP